MPKMWLFTGEFMILKSLSLLLSSISLLSLIITNSPCIAQSNLPKHKVVDNSSLAPKKGRRIQINVQDPNLAPSECIALIDLYRNKAEPDGQVSVHKPSKKLGGLMSPWCVENFDGKGIFFNDALF